MIQQENNSRIDEQIKELISINKRCITLIKEENLENLLSLFRRKEKLTQLVINNVALERKEAIILQLTEYNQTIIKILQEKKLTCSENLSAHYRQDNANKQYIEAQKNLLDCI